VFTLAGSRVGHRYRPGDDYVETILPVGGTAILHVPAGNYRSLLIEGIARGTAATANVILQATFNTDTGANYNNERIVGNGSSASGAGGLTDSFIYAADICAATAPADQAAAVRLEILEPLSADFHKGTLGHYSLKNGTGAVTNLFNIMTAGQWRSKVPIYRIDLTPSSGLFAAGTRFTLRTLF
jgi:hypothetical protein